MIFSLSLRPFVSLNPIGVSLVFLYGPEMEGKRSVLVDPWSSLKRNIPFPFVLLRSSGVVVMDFSKW